MEPHIHALGSLRLDSIIYHALRRAVVGLQWRASLLMSHRVQDLADVNRLSRINIQCSELRLRRRRHYRLYYLRNGEYWSIVRRILGFV